jgi:predicted lipid-binding transport protein (Tim44 family)
MLRKLLISLFITIISFSLLITDAEAKRFGGGKSFGSNRSYSQSTAQRVPPAAAKPQSTASRWLGPLAGLAMGGLLASFFMGHGLGAGILSWVMLAGAIFLIWRLISRFRQVEKPAHHAAFQTEPETGRTFTNVPFTSSVQSTPDDSSDFDEESFLRHAKTIFIRLQAAYDNKNLTDIRTYTTPEVFAEIQMQLQERGEGVNQTDVITINAELVNRDNEGASVLFSGLVREEQGHEPQNIKEVWHFNQNRNDWVISGIRQE